ncbi:hypothetical protein PBRA_008165 [Plasmodiophora brassicae]|uniref:Uncharacterized protein n=1 Tax=Plasmodiophora brassicae TaxID=37360 RepID=A0A0G4IZR4_PLABS|nr:hypothetical protein PBRA_008165 [Plasmodiophora brassicae]
MVVCQGTATCGLFVHQAWRERGRLQHQHAETEGRVRGRRGDRNFSRPNRVQVVQRQRRRRRSPRHWRHTHSGASSFGAALIGKDALRPRYVRVDVSDRTWRCSKVAWSTSLFDVCKGALRSNVHILVLCDRTRY